MPDPAVFTPEQEQRIKEMTLGLLETLFSKTGQSAVDYHSQLQRCDLIPEWGHVRHHLKKDRDLYGRITSYRLDLETALQIDFFADGTDPETTILLSWSTIQAVFPSDESEVRQVNTRRKQEYQALLDAKDVATESDTTSADPSSRQQQIRQLWHWLV